MLAQKAKSVGQSFTAISEKGIGKFGFDLEQLEDVELLKPGVAELMGPIENNVEAVTNLLKSSAVWSGKDGITTIDDFLSSESIQDAIQQGVFKEAYSQLEATGIMSSVNSVQEVAGLVQAAAEVGPDQVTAWAKGQLGDLTGQVQGQIEGAVRQAQYAVDFVTKKVPETLTSAVSKVGHVGTATRQGLDSTVNELIGNAKVPGVAFQVEKFQAQAASSAFDTLADRLRNM